jgi:hypothetical protein
MTVKILKNGNVVTEMHGFEGQMCVAKAEEVIAKLKAQGIHVDIDTFHLKSAECGTLTHVADVESGK